LLYPVIRKHAGARVAILFTSIVFAFVHPGLFHFVMILPVGLMLAYIFEKTQSLWAVIAAHAFFNSGQIVFVLLLRTAIGEGP
jgi:membrane protease YdiL (CAAX protease family)